MFDEGDRSWTARSVIAGRPGAEIYFLLPREFHIDANTLPGRTVAIPAPVLAGPDPYAPASLDVLDNEGVLADYYRAVLGLAERYGRPYNAISHYMWLRLELDWEGGAIRFSWYDSLAGMEHLFDWLQTAADGDLWSDVEQGWEVIAIRQGSLLHFREGGYDQGGEYANVAFPCDELLASVSRLRERMATIIACLTAEVGGDYWTRYRYDLRTDLPEEWRRRRMVPPGQGPG